MDGFKLIKLLKIGEKGVHDGYFHFVMPSVALTLKVGHFGFCLNTGDLLCLQLKLVNPYLHGVKTI